MWNPQTTFLNILYDKNSWKRHLANVLRKYDEPEFLYICDGKE